MRFEGEELDGYTISLRSFKGPIQMPLTRGERFVVTCTVEVMEVAVKEDRRTGQVFRDHVVKVVEVDSE